MSEKMIPLSIDELLSRMTKEYNSNSIAFGVHEGFKISRYDDLMKGDHEEKYLPIFGEKLEVALVEIDARVGVPELEEVWLKIIAKFF